jgi:hypothetical protein
MLHETQRRLAAALLGRSPSPDGIVGDGVAPAVRLSVHRNNVRSSLRCAIETTFPVTRALIGARRFGALAQRFVRDEPPHHGWLSAFGGGFPVFLLEEARCDEECLYADVARLEWLRVRAAHAPSDQGLQIEDLTRLAEADLLAVRLRLHPSVGLFRSRYSALAVWRSQRTGWPQGELPTGDDDLLVVLRCDAAVEIRAVDRGTWAFLLAIASGWSLATAVAAALDASPAFPFGEVLADLARSGVLAHPVNSTG